MTTFTDSRRLTPAEVEAFGAELDALRNEIMAQVGEREAAYIRRTQALVRYTEVGGRALLFAGWFPPAWLAGAGLLGLSKIVENMELAHNVMHGQYDWMNDPALRGDTYDWDNACNADAWRHSHNYLHHTFTNVRGKDRDVGYGLLRMFPEQKWAPKMLAQPVGALALASFFEWFVAVHDLELDRAWTGKRPWREVLAELPPVLKKAIRQAGKDYALFPLLAGPAFLPVLTGNLAANFIRNYWAFAIIFCGHFTEDVTLFEPEALEGETRGAWYLRQLHGSGNLEGGKLLHFMSGNLSHQIEHHLFPDVPAMRYGEMAVRVREICEKYGQPYNTGSFAKQFTGVLKRIARHSLPSRPKQVKERAEAPDVSPLAEARPTVLNQGAYV